MAAISSEGSTFPAPYCRKQKSLALLCSNFLSIYDREGVDTIGVDDAASRLGVERRRIYDIINILESLGVLSKKAKNQYTWRGFGVIPKTLQLLKEQGPNESYSSFDDLLSLKVGNSHNNSNSSTQNEKAKSTSVTNSPRTSTADNRKEKSLGLLTQNFVKLFLCSENVEMISLDEASKILLEDANDLPGAKGSATKVRRLYDITNVLASLNFIEKTHHPQTRRPAFKWLGMSTKRPLNTLILETKKRMFGNELTNTSFKRCKAVPTVDANFKQTGKTQPQTLVKCEPLENGIDENNSERSRKNYQFGPFAPIHVPKTEASDNNKEKQVFDWETLASNYSPQYHNQALKGLFAHYMEAWKSWYS